MKVCMLAYTYYEEDNRVMRYAETLAARGDHVDVIALRHPDEQRYAEVQGVNVLKIQTRIQNEKAKRSYLFRVVLFLLRSAWLLARRHRRLRYDLIHVHSVPDFLVFAALFPKLTGAKVILDIHDVLPEFYASKFGAGQQSFVFKVLLIAERVSAGIADHVIIANDLWRDRLVARSVREEKCTTILNFPDRRLFYRRRKTRKDERFVILYPGSLGKHQGLDIAIRAFGQISNQVPHAEFHIYGDGGEKENLIALAHELRLDDRVFIHDAVPLRAIAAVIADADLGVVPKRSDTFGDEAFSTKTLEFMILGVPLIVAATKIDKFYFSDSLVRFFRSGDEDDLAKAMLELIQDLELRQRLARNGLQFANQYDWESNKGRYLDIVDLLVPERAAANCEASLATTAGSCTPK
jgi:glycosyltransferase involved in cell wall biosynthesis